MFATDTYIESCIGIGNRVEEVILTEETADLFQVSYILEYSSEKDNAFMDWKRTILMSISSLKGWF